MSQGGDLPAADAQKLKKQLEYYESEVRRLESLMSQQKLSYGKQVAELEDKVKHYKEIVDKQAEDSNKEEAPKDEPPTVRTEEPPKI